MENHLHSKDISGGQPVEGVVKKDNPKYITELDETKTRVIDRYRIGKQIGKVPTIDWGKLCRVALQLCMS